MPAHHFTTRHTRRQRRLALGALVALAAALAAGAALAHTKQYGPWEPPASIESIPGTSSEVNTTSLDGCPILSPDGLRLWMASDRPGGLGKLDIWYAERPNRHAPFGPPVNAGAPINSPEDDFCPSPMAKGYFLWVSTRPGGCGDADMYLTRERHGEWREPVHLGCTVNSPAQEASPYLLLGDDDRKTTLLFSSNRPGGTYPDGAVADADIYMSVLGRFGFGPAQPVDELNSPVADARPNLRRDGLEIVFDSNRPGALGGQDIYTASRRSLRHEWSAPVNVAALNTPSMETRASFSWNARTLLFGSNRPGGEGSTDIYYTTRDRMHQDD